MRKKNVIAMIGMIIAVVVLFNGQLSAEEAVGVSIFPKLNTVEPFPYPDADENQSLIWVTTIYQPKAAWIKIHFSSLELKQKDFVNLIDEHCRIIEHIQFGDIHNKHHSRFKLLKNEDHTVNFWTLAVDGPKVRIELHRKSNKAANKSFTINEIAIGTKPLFDRGLGPMPIYNDDEKNNTIALPKGKWPYFDERQMIFLEEVTGIMLYQRGTTWYKCKGTLISNSPNLFLPQEPIINVQSIADTSEVRFYLVCPQNVMNIPDYINFFGDSFEKSQFSLGINKGDEPIVLRRNSKLEEFCKKYGKITDKLNAEEDPCDCDGDGCPDIED